LNFEFFTVFLKKEAFRRTVMNNLPDVK